MCGSRHLVHGSQEKQIKRGLRPWRIYRRGVCVDCALGIHLAEDAEAEGRTAVAASMLSGNPEQPDASMLIVSPSTIVAAAALIAALRLLCDHERLILFQNIGSVTQEQLKCVGLGMSDSGSYRLEVPKQTWNIFRPFFVTLGSEGYRNFPFCSELAKSSVAEQ